jgi:hypothetical protein
MASRIENAASSLSTLPHESFTDLDEANSQVISRVRAHHRHQEFLGESIKPDRRCSKPLFNRRGRVKTLTCMAPQFTSPNKHCREVRFATLTAVCLNGLATGA